MPKLNEKELALVDEMCAIACREETLREYEVASLTASLEAAKVNHTAAAQRAKDTTALCEKLRKERDAK